MKKTTSKVTTKRAPTFRTRLMALAVSSCFSGAVYALGTDHTVVAGSATFSQSGNVMTVSNSNGTIINWPTLSVLKDEKLIFDQAANSSVLNRVIGMEINGKWVIDPTVIAGTISSKGSVWIINTSGVLVKQGAVIDVARFVGSTIDVSNANFLAGKFLFDGTPGTGTVVVEKDASITTGMGGSVYLIGSSVTNNGIITTPNGETILAAGQSVSIVDTGTPGVKVEITGSEGKVTNLGTVLAEAGRIGMAGALVRNSGMLNASSVVKEGGRIFLKASQDAYVDGSGRIVTTGTKGGSVEVLGNRVAVTDNASIDASGVNGGGTVLVGGDYQGKNAAVQNSTVTYFGKNASIKADATDSGNGGKVILWADDTTRAHGSISARGGANGGNGGFVETSGKRYLATDGARADLRAPKGKTGSWLLDPADITITAGGVTGGTWVNDVDYYFNPGSGSSTVSDGDLSSRLSSANVIVDTSRGSGGTGHITVNDGVSISTDSGRTLSLWADGNIAFNGTSTGITLNGISLDLSAGRSIPSGTISMTGVTATNQGALTMETYGGSISITNSVLPVAYADIAIATRGGNLNITNSNVDVSLSFGTSNGMTVDLTGTGTTGNLALQASNSGSNGSASLNSAGSQTITANGITLRAGSDGSNNRAEIISYGGQTITANSIALYGGAAGQGNLAVIGNYSNLSQTINTHSLWLQGGGSQASDFNDKALIESSTGSQQINIKGAGGSITMKGGSGGSAASAYGGLAGASVDSDCATAAGANYCYSSHNSAEIIQRDSTGFYGQTIDFALGGGSVAMYGGSGGAGNSARISNRSLDGVNGPGVQMINPSSTDTTYYLEGGSSGGKMVYGSDGKWYDFRNSANIDSDSSYMMMYGSSVTLVGGSGVSGALIGSSPVSGAGNMYLGLSGDLTMRGGSSGAVKAVNDQTKTTNFASPVGIGSDKNNIVYLGIGGQLSMESGTNAGGQALIGSLHGTTDTTVSAGSISMASRGALVAIGSLADDASLQTGSSVSLTAGSLSTAIGSGAAANVMIGANVGDATVTVSANGGDASIGQIKAGAGTVTVNAVGAILDANGAGNVNITAGTVFLNSRGGRAGTLAVDTDTSATNISVQVGCAGECPLSSGYGGISLRNYSTAAPTSIALRDDSVYGGPNGGTISFYNQSDLTVPSSVALTAPTGDMLVSTSGNLDLAAIVPSQPTRLGGPLFAAGTPGSLILTSIGGDITASGGAFTVGTKDLSLVANNVSLSGTSVTAASVNLVGRNSVTLSNGARVQATAGDLTVVSPTISLIASQILAYGDLKLVGGNILGSQGSRFAAGYDGSAITNANANVQMTALGDVVLNDGVTVESGNDTIINLQGPTSKLYLNDTTGLAASKIISDIATQVPATTHVNVLYGVGGSVVIDGEASTTTTAGGSGFYVLDGSTAARPGFGLDVVYTSAATTGPAGEALKTTTSTLNKTTTDDNLSDETSSNNTLILKTVASNASQPSTTGGEDGTFGSEDKKEKNGDTTQSGDKKEQSNGKSTSKNQCS